MSTTEIQRHTISNPASLFGALVEYAQKKRLFGVDLKDDQGYHPLWWMRQEGIYQDESLGQREVLVWERYHDGLRELVTIREDPQLTAYFSPSLQQSHPGLYNCIQEG